MDQDLAKLRTFPAREDYEKYTTLLCTVLHLFGLGVIDSLEHTMKKYLRQTDGVNANERRNEEDLERCNEMLCHNNNAERPFAVLRQYQRMYPSISLKNLSWLSTSLVNGTHAPADKGHAGGIALTAHALLQDAIGNLCSVRRKSPGRITTFIRAAHAVDRFEAVTARKRKAREKYANNVRKKAKRAALTDYAEEVCATSMVTTLPALQIQLEAHAGSKNGQMKFLKDQFHARVSGATPRNYPSLGKDFRTKFGKLKLTSSVPKQCNLAYLTSLISAMIVEDCDLIGVNENRMPQLTQHFIRVVPEISSEFTNPKSIHLKAEFGQQIAELSAPIDDPMYVELHGKYFGAILFDFETRSSSKLFRIVAIQFVRSFNESRADCWEATCEPVYRNSATGHFSVPEDAQVKGSNVTIKHALQGYALAEYRTGTDELPTYLPWVDLYIDHFRTAIQPKYASLFGDLPSSSQDLPACAPKDLPSSAKGFAIRRPKKRAGDLPSSSQDLPSTNPKDLPSSPGRDLPSSDPMDLPSTNYSTNTSTRRSSKRHQT